MNPVEPVFTSPHQVRVGTWPLRFRALASAPAGEPGGGQLYPGGPCPMPVRRGFRPRRRSSIPVRFPFPLAEAKMVWAWTLPGLSAPAETGLEPLVREPDRPARNPGLPRFPRRRVPRPDQARSKCGIQQGVASAGLCRIGVKPVDSCVNLCGRIEFRHEEQRFAFSTESGQPARASRLASSSSHSSSAALSFSCAASRAFMVEAKPEGSRE